MKISDKIRKKLKDADAKYFCNDNISHYMDQNDLALLIDEVTESMKKVLESLVIDIENDHNTRDTAHRVAKMMVTETFAGRFLPPPKITAFPNVTEYDQVYVTGPTQSGDFPIKNPIQANLSGWQDAFITKINKKGNAIVYSTFLGGTSDEKANCIAVDKKMAAYVGGETYSSDFPTKNPFQANNEGEYDGFIAKLK